MRITSHGNWAILLGTAVCAGYLFAGSTVTLAQMDMTQLSQQGKKDDSIGGSIKRGIGKVGKALTPDNPPRPAVDDPVALSTKAAPGAHLHVAVGNLYVESGKMDLATEHFQKALKISPNYLGALLGYARVKDRVGRTDDAITLYQRAVKAHPNSASALNNFGLFYAKHRKLDEAVKILAKAVEISPRNVRYRNNLATILAEMGRNKEAFNQLQAVHGEAVAYYNLGYLLERKGDAQSAAQHYAMSLKTNPEMLSARMGIQRLAAARSAQTVQRPPATRQVHTTPPAAPARNVAPRQQQPDRLGTRPSRSESAMPMAPASPRHITPPPTSRSSQVPAARQLPPQPKQATPLGPAPSVRVRGTRDNGLAPLPPGTFVPKRLPPVDSAGQTPSTDNSPRNSSGPVAPLPPPTRGPALQFSP